MTLPRGTDYDLAVQMPRVSFGDSDLRNCVVETNQLGLPKPYSGGFTTTFRLYGTSGDWAVRCFIREVQSLERRYKAINDFFSRTSSPYFVDAKYLAKGIRINGIEYPIIKMKWLHGEPLNIYISNNYRDKQKMEALLSHFVKLVKQLDLLGIAHGDLQHGNIIVVNHNLYLIDYDGMFLPDLSELGTNEVGHINYQHPQRSSRHFSKEIDRFAAIIIYLGLRAIAIKPDLWKQYDDGENILFRKTDFEDLHKSNLLRDLSHLPDFKELIKRFIGVCYLDFGKVPSLSMFIDGNFAIPSESLHKISIDRSQYLILDGTYKASILEHVGQKVEIVGLITASKSGYTKRQAPYTMLNMGGKYPLHTFTIALWSETIEALKVLGLSPIDYTNKWISVTGVASQYKGRPQLYVEIPTQIRILSGAPEAQKLLSQSKTSVKPIVTIQTNTSSNLKTTRNKPYDKEAEIFNMIYKNMPTSSSTLSNVPLHGNTNKYSQPTKPISTNPKAGKTSIVPPVVGGIICGLIGAGVFQSPAGLLIGAIIGIFLGNQLNK